MNILYPYMLITVLVGMLSKTIPVGRNIETFSYENERKSFVCRLVILSILCVLSFFSGFRHIVAVANDEAIYRNRIMFYKNCSIFYAIKNSESFLLAIVLWIGANLFPTTQGGIFLVAFFTIYLYLVTFSRDCTDFHFAILLYLVAGLFSSSLNGIAQTFATSVFAFGYKHLYKKNIKKFFIITVICFFIHRASIFLIVLYIIANEVFGRKNSWLINILFLSAMIIGYQILDSIIGVFGILEEYAGLSESGHHGVNIITIIINIAPALVGLMIKPAVKKEDAITRTSINLTIINSLIMCASILDVYIARFAMFTAPFPIIMLSRSGIYLKGKKNMLEPIVVILYTLAFIIRYYDGRVLYYFSL